jgi:hypothetical protein
MTTAFARAIEGIPVVGSTTERDLLFSVPSTDQRVQLRATGEIQRYTGVQWVSDLGAPAAGRTVPTLSAYLANNLGSLFNPMDYGAVGNSVTDDTTAVQAAITAAKAVYGGTLILTKLHRVSNVMLASCNGFVVLFLSGGLIGLESGAVEAVLTIKNSTDVSLLGHVAISGAYNVNCAAAIALYTDNGAGCTNIFIDNPAISGALRAFKVGRTTEPGPQISEITIKGGFTYGTPTVLEAYGTQTVVTAIGCQLLANGLGGNAGWQALPQYNVRVFGAVVFVSGGEVQHPSSATGGCLVVEPITDATNGNLFGSISVVNAEIESAAPLVLAQNTLAVAAPLPPVSGVNLQGCLGYHPADSFAFCQLSASYTGRLIIGGGSRFYAGVARTNLNVQALGAADLYIDDGAFATNFVQGLSGLSGGIAHFTYRRILWAFNTVNQALTAATQATLKWQALSNTSDTSFFSGSYSTGTGQFTVPTGGLKSVTLFATVRTAAPTATLAVDVYVAGAFYASLPMSMGGAGNNGTVSGTVLLGDLAAGTTVEVKATCGSTTTCNFGGLEQMVLHARN